MKVGPQLNVWTRTHIRRKSGQQRPGIDPFNVAASGEDGIDNTAGLGHQWRAGDIPNDPTRSHQAERVLEQPPLPHNQGSEVFRLLAPPSLWAAA
jgi:hypothetical protein